jgi:hypothetical protein
MSWWAWAIFFVVGALAVWGAISPRTQWNTLSAWQYRNPEANEPSDTAYAVTRVLNVIGLIGVIVMLTLLFIAGVGVTA